MKKATSQFSGGGTYISHAALGRLAWKKNVQMVVGGVFITFFMIGIIGGLMDNKQTLRDGLLAGVIMLIPFVIVCIARALYCWRFRVTASLRGITVQPVFGTTWSVALSDIERVERTVDRRAGGAVRRLVIDTDAGKVTMRDALAGIDELDAFLITYNTGKKGSLA